MNPIDTNENTADLFTKALGSDKFWYFSNQIMGDADYQQYKHLYHSETTPSYVKRNGGGANVRGRDPAKPEMSVTLCALLPADQRSSPPKGITLHNTTDAEFGSFYRFCASTTPSKGPS